MKLPESLLSNFRIVLYKLLLVYATIFDRTIQISDYLPILHILFNKLIAFSKISQHDSDNL